MGAVSSRRDCEKIIRKGGVSVSKAEVLWCYRMVLRREFADLGLMKINSLVPLVDTSKAPLCLLENI